MKVLNVTILGIAIYAINSGEGCFIKSKERFRSPIAPWDEKKVYPRKFANSTRVCGADGADERVKQWILYIHHVHQKKVCIGTIINSNMVLTSQQCLMLDENKVNIFHAWRVPSSGRGLADVKDIKLSTEWNLEKGKIYPVEKIIYSQHFSYKKGVKDTPQPDIAILVSNFALNRDAKKSSMCVPTRGLLPTYRILYREGGIQGIPRRNDIGGGGGDPPLRGRRETAESNATQSKKRILDSDSEEVDGRNPNEEPHPPPEPSTASHPDYIKRAVDCYQDYKLPVKPAGDNEMFCRSVGPNEPHDVMLGSPLYVIVKRNIDGGPWRSFLVGIATWVDDTLRSGERFAYFTNINSILRYLEYQATLLKSEWLKPPTPYDDVWQWETYKGKMDESLNCECGKRSTSKGRIVGGQEATPHEFPWMVKLITPVELLGKKHGPCGATILNDRVLITSAQCVTDLNSITKHKDLNFNVLAFPVEDYKFYANAHYLAPTQGEVLLRVKKIHVHPGFVEVHRLRDYVDFDLALIILEEPMNLLDNKFGQICLPEKNKVSQLTKSKAELTLAGWGLRFKGGGKCGENENCQVDRQSPVLEKINLPLTDMTECSLKILTTPNLPHSQDLGPTNTRICATKFKAYENAAPHDFGGPLMYSSGQTSQLGLFSFSNGLATIFTNVEEFIPYINYYSNLYGAKGCKQIKQSKKK